MLDAVSGRPRTGSMLVKHKDLPVSSGAGTEPRVEEDEETSGKLKTHTSIAQRPLVHRLDNWLTGLSPFSLRPWLSNCPSLPSILFVYTLCSLLLFSGYLHSFVARSSSIASSIEEISTLNTINPAHLLSKVSSLRPPPLLLDPDVLSTRIDGTGLSACLWTTEDSVEMIGAWASMWTGPISLLVTTKALPSSPEHTNLLVRLAHLQSQAPALRNTLSVHVLHLHHASELHPNAFLNLARLLSPSPRVVLFPGNVTYAPPKSLYNALLSHQPSSSSALASPNRVRKRKPIVLTSKVQTSFPFAPLAPLALARDDSTWCTERFFAGMSREADWEECLWQTWLGNFGDVEVRQIQGWTALSQTEDEDEETMENPAAVKLHRRLMTKFRSETCALAVRRFAALRDSSGADTKKARWLKRVCRSWGPA